jgi:hypothetical protein
MTDYVTLSHDGFARQYTIRRAIVEISAGKVRDYTSMGPCKRVFIPVLTGKRACPGNSGKFPIDNQ